MPRSRDFDPSAPVVYRPLSGRLLYGACLAVALWWAGATVSADGFGALLPDGAYVLGIMVLGWSAFWRSAVVVDDRAVRLLNVVRDIEVEWAALEAVTTRWALTLHAAGRQHRSWVATSRSRANTRRRVRGMAAAPDPWAPPPSSEPGSGGLMADAADAEALVQNRWERWRMTAVAPVPAPAAGEPVDAVVVRWNVPVIAVTVVCAVLAVLGSVAR